MKPSGNRLNAQRTAARGRSGGDMSAATAFSEFRLGNGLRVLFHENHEAPIVTVNLLYHVGSKNERHGRRGLAHLFEHLMFDGSKHVARGRYDYYCTSVGGDNNAYTTCDLTDYYLLLPADKLALGLWLEADRMAELDIGEISLSTQKNVVIEEKRQTTDDTPYGNMVQTMVELAYAPEHPYSWETIGLVEDIEKISLEDVYEFYRHFYAPSNAMLVVAGDFDPAEALRLIQGYFGPIPSGERPASPALSDSMLNYGRETRLIDRIIPFNAAFLSFHAPPLGHPDLCALELLSGILAEGESSRLYHELEYRLEIASETGSFVDDGELGSLFYVYAVGRDRRIGPGRLRRELTGELLRIAGQGVSERELQKAKNQKSTRIAAALQSISTCAERLAHYALLFDDPGLAFHEATLYESITPDDIRRVASTYLTEERANVVEYKCRK